MTRQVCVELPAEAKNEQDEAEDNVALLQMSLYGTRDAAAKVQSEVKRFMIGNGFKQGLYNPCTFYHTQKCLRTMVHGDDFVTAGSREEAKWFEVQMKKKFEIKTKLVGNAKGELKEANILNRVVRVGPQGWEYEADQRHADLIVGIRAGGGLRSQHPRRGLEGP